MTRSLIATTAIATLLATGAYAQDASRSMQAPATTETANPVVPLMKHDGQLASNIVGETVSDGTGDDARNIGYVNDIVIAKDGQVESVVIGVGGFLGIGEKNVALNYADIDWAERNGDRWIVVSATKEELGALPAFDRKPYDPAPAAASDTSAARDTVAQAPATSGVQAPTEGSGTEVEMTAAIDKSQLNEVPAGKMRSEELVGTTVYGAGDADVGEIGDVVLTQDGKVDAVIIDVGGFLGVGEKQVAVGMDNLAFMIDQDGGRYLYTNFTKEQLDAAATYDEGSWAQKRDDQRLIITR